MEMSEDSSGVQLQASSHIPAKITCKLSEDAQNLIESPAEKKDTVGDSKDYIETPTTINKICFRESDKISVEMSEDKERNSREGENQSPKIDCVKPKMSSSLDDFEVISVIGTGTYGTCKKIRRKKDGKIMVWKEMDYGSMTESEKQMLVSEVNLLRELRHQHIVKYYDRIIDRSRAIIYIIMEYCQGGDLASIISKNRKDGTHVEEDFAWKILIQMTLALKECHRRKNGRAVLHRDLKPANVFLDNCSNVKLGDFGLARVLHHESSFASTYVGTPYYMSPELVNNLSYNEKSDIWSLGCMLYELCALAPPFTAPNQCELNRKIRIGDFPRLPMKYSTELDLIIRKMIQVEVSKRPSIDAILADPSVQHKRENIEKTSVYAQKHSKPTAKCNKVYCDLKEETLIMKMKQLEMKEKELESRERSVALREKLAEEKMKSAMEMYQHYSDSDSSPLSRNAVSPFLQSPSQDDDLFSSPQHSCLSRGAKDPESPKKHVTFDHYLNGKENLRKKTEYSRPYFDVYTGLYRREDSITRDIARREATENLLGRLKSQEIIDNLRDYRNEHSKFTSRNILFLR